MSALTFNLIRLAYLVLLWLFVLAAIGVLRRDLLTRGRSARSTKLAGEAGLQPLPAGGNSFGYEPELTAIPAGPLVPEVAGGFGDLPVTVVGPPAADALANVALPVTVVGPQAAAVNVTPPITVVGPGATPQPANATALPPSGLAVTQGALAGTWIPLFDSPITIGRSPENTLVLEDGYASGKHARVFPQNGEWYLEDLNSTNGTLLAGQRVAGVIPLPLGAAVKIGGTEIELVH